MSVEPNADMVNNDLTPNVQMGSTFQLQNCQFLQVSEIIDV